MKQTSFYFAKLFQHERMMASNPSAMRLLVECFDDCFSATSVMPLQRAYLLAETGYVWQHFGLSAFAPVARCLLVDEFAAATSISSDVISTWLETVCFQLVEELNVLRVLTGEPDWDLVDRDFFFDLTRRIACSEQTESFDLGLDVWNRSLISRLTAVVANAIAGIANGEVPPEYGDLSGVPFVPGFLEAIGDVVTEVSANPIKLLIWRIQFLTSFRDTRCESRIFVRESDMEGEELANRFAGLLTLFLPHVAPCGYMLLPATPLPAKTVATILSPSYHSEHFDLSVFRQWLALPVNESEKWIDELAQQAVQTGLLFEVPHAKKRAYGLTATAMGILKPFHSSLTATLLYEPNLETSANLGYEERKLG